MSLIDIFGYLLYIILIFVTVTWMYGVRIKNIQYTTALGSLYLLVLTIIFPLCGVSFLNILWLAPLGVILSTLFNFILIYKIPVLTILFRIILDAYVSLLRIGLNRKKDTYNE